jgi:predicted nucleic acid-binding Zn ribbon protein
MSKPSQGPRPLSDILGELFAARGYGRLRARQELRDAWNAAVGQPNSSQTQLGEVRRGVLNVTVAHSALLEELAAFHKPALLAALRCGAPGTTIHDIRFRVGAVAPEVERPAAVGSPPAGQPGEPKSGHLRQAALGGRSQAGKRSNSGHGSASNPGLP